MLSDLLGGKEFSYKNPESIRSSVILLMAVLLAAVRLEVSAREGAVAAGYI